MKKLITALLLSVLATGLHARKSEYAPGAETVRLKAAAGDTIVLKDGLWRDVTFDLRGEGTAEKPVVLMAANPGKAVVTGDSQMSVSGNHIIVAGLHFRDIVRAKSGLSTFLFHSSQAARANHCTLTGCLFTGSGVERDDTESKWVSVYGEDNTVKNCTFIDKANMGTLLVVWLEDGIVPAHKITGNYFSRPRSLPDSKGGARNGQETIRIGTSDVSMQDGRCMVEGNFFYRCNGETEIISNKSCENVYRGNVFRECSGALTLRHGNRCTVDGNFFFGDGAVETGGIRIIGEDHKVFNNYFNSLSGTGYRSAICIIQGETNPALNGYFRAQRIVVVFNTIVNCREGISLNYGTSRQNQPVEDITIANNVICTSNVRDANIIVRTYPVEAIDVTWKNNFSYGGTLTKIDLQEADANTRDPSLRNVGGVWMPSDKSFLVKKSVTGYDFVTHDALGRERAGAKIPGALNPAPATFALPSESSTGAGWYVP